MEREATAQCEGMEQDIVPLAGGAGWVTSDTVALLSPVKGCS